MSSSACDLRFEIVKDRLCGPVDDVLRDILGRTARGHSAIMRGAAVPTPGFRCPRARLSRSAVALVRKSSSREDALAADAIAVLSRLL